MWKILSDPVLSLIYPQECSVCRGEVASSDHGVACSPCWESTKVFNGTETLCTKCGAFLFEGGRAAGAATCHRCEDHHYDRAASIGIYEHALSASVLRLKSVPHMPLRLKMLLLAAFARLEPDHDVLLVPIPLSSRRLAERGFNQAGILARMLAKESMLDLDEHSLVRVTHTPMHRVGMDKKARSVTVRDAFEVVRPKLIEGRRILLIDDVFTSGETGSACADVLKRRGAAMVEVLTIARAA